MSSCVRRYKKDTQRDEKPAKEKKTIERRK